MLIQNYHQTIETLLEKLTDILMSSIPKKYVPESLTKKDKEKQKKAIEKSKEEAKKGIYKTRPKVKSFKSKPSTFTEKAKAKGISGSLNFIASKITKTPERKKEVLKGLREIIKKGRGAYFSAGSRPNQTPTSWAKARVYSVLFGGKARGVDKAIVKKYNLPLL